MPTTLALLSLCLTGFCWGTTGIFVRLLSAKGFTGFELLALRMSVVFIFLLPVMLFKFGSLPFRKHGHHPIPIKKPNVKLITSVAFLMLLYYLGAITAFQHLPVVIAVLLFGSSPLIAWLFPLIYEKRLPHGVELLQGVGVLIAITGLLYLTLTKHTATSVSPKGAWDLLGYAGGITSAVVTVITGKLLSGNRQAKPSPLEISFMSSVFGLLLMPIVIFHSSHAYPLIAQNWETLIGFGVIATLIPGSAFAYACNHLASTITATVSVQLPGLPSTF